MKITEAQLRNLVKENLGSDMKDKIVSRYERWAKDNGHITPAASSVMATFIRELSYKPSPDILGALASHYGIDPYDVIQDLQRQRRERKIQGLSESQLRKLVREQAGLTPQNMTYHEAVAFELEHMRLAGLYKPLLSKRTGRPQGYRYGGILDRLTVYAIGRAYNPMPDMIKVLEFMEQGRLHIRGDGVIFLDGYQVWPGEVKTKLGQSAYKE